jgi:nitrite reductase (NO-forming)
VTDAAARVGEAGRVRVVQHQARLTLAVAAAYTAASPLAALAPHRTGWWLPLHLFLVGGLLSAVSGATQLFAVTWAAGPPAGDRAAAAQRALIGGGALLLAAGRELRLPAAVATSGGVAVIAGLATLAVLLVRIVKPAVQRRFDPALRFCLAALAAGVAGCGIGVRLLSGAAGVDRTRLLAAHVMLNLLGLVGLVIAGTLPFFVATQARTKISPRATPRAQAVLLGWFAAALLIAALGLLAGSSALAATGLGGYATGLALLVTRLPKIGTKQLQWAGPRLVQLGAGVIWWTAGTGIAAVRAGGGRPPFDHTVLAVIAVGGYAQIVLASLAYLGPVLRAGGHERLSAGFALTRSWTGLASANLTSLALATGQGALAAVALGIWAADVAWRSMRLVRPARRVLRPPP